MTSRRTLAFTFALSLLLHAAVAAVMYRAHAPLPVDGANRERVPQTVELWFEAEPTKERTTTPETARSSAAASQAEGLKPPADSGRATRSRAPKVGKQRAPVRGVEAPPKSPSASQSPSRESASPPQRAPGAVADTTDARPGNDAPSTDAPIAASAPPIDPATPRLNLLPPMASSDIAVPSHGGGRTLYPGDAEFSEEVRRAEEEFRVGQRVDRWAQDGAAEARAQFGGHPYLGAVGDALRSGFGSEEGATPAALGSPGMMEKMAQRWLGAAEQYAKTGNPNLAPPGIASRQSERARELFGNEPGANELRALIQATETMEDLRTGVPLLSLTLELQQGSDGGLMSQKILESSGSGPFDEFVLRVVPEAIAAAGPPPADVLRGRDRLRSVWRIEGWPGAGKGALSYLPEPGAYGIPLEVVKKQIMGDHRPFDFRARVLRVY